MAEIRLSTSPRRRSSRLRRWLLLTLGAVLLLSAAASGLSIYIGWSLTHPKRVAITETPSSVGIPYLDIAFPSRRGDVQLKGWYLQPTGTDAHLTIVLAHGYSKNRLIADVPGLEVAKSLSAAGYGVVMFDFRASGESGGSLTTIGQYEKDDLLGALDWVKANHPGKMGIVGFSMGASAAVLAAAEEPQVAGVIADSPFANLGRYLSGNMSHWTHLPDVPFTPLILHLLPPITGIRPDGVDVEAAAKKVYPRPILFIHSKDDPAIPAANSEGLTALHPDRFQLWETTKAGHIQSFKLYPDEYKKRMLAFIAGWNG